MANDIDMWNDIEQLEHTGDRGNAELMLSVYSAYFIDEDMAETKKAIDKAHAQSPDFPFDFRGYGITPDEWIAEGVE